jgi:hypothetical protein
MIYLLCCEILMISDKWYFVIATSNWISLAAGQSPNLFLVCHNEKLMMTFIVCAW